MSIIANNNISASDIVSEFGAYYRPEGQNLQRLRKRIYQRTKTPSIARGIQTTESVYRHATSSVTEVVQPFQVGWTPKGDTNFTPREITLRRIKIDQKYYPDEIVESWLGFLANLDDADRKNWPIVRYVWEELVMSRKEQDLEMKAYYQGVYVAHTPGTAGTTKQSMDGLRIQAREAVDNGGKDYTSIVGNLTAATIFDQVEQFASKILDDNQELIDNGVNVHLCMSKKWFVKYLQDKRNTLGSNVNYEADKMTVDFMDNIKLVGLPSMANFDDLLAFPDFNLVHCYNRLTPPTPVMETSQREVSLYTDWREGLGFVFNEYVFFVDNGASGSGSAS